MELKNWKDITVEKFYKVKNLLEEPDDYTVLNLIDTIYDVDSSNIPLSEFSKYNKALDFLNTEIPTVNLEDTYTINGVEYKTGYNLTTVSAAQYIDYQNYIGTGKWEDFLSVMFIPVGHNYNDGYDINKVKKDILQMPITVVKSLVFFYTIQLGTLIHHILYYFKKSMKKMNLTKEQKEKVEDLLKKAELVNLELSHLS